MKPHNYIPNAVKRELCEAKQVSTSSSEKRDYSHVIAFAVVTAIAGLIITAWLLFGNNIS